MKQKKYDILSIFPDCLDSYFNSSLIAKALDRRDLQIRFHDIREYALDKHHRVDDEIYGLGAGMLFKPEPVTRAIREISSKYQNGIRIYLSPQGRVLKQDLIEELFAQYDQFLLLCARYEGVDQRVIDHDIDLELSLGDFILMGGELAAAAFIEASVRYIPGLVGKGESVRQDSFSQGLLEHPHYTRPQVFEGHEVPRVLSSGNHEAIERWRLKESLRKTLKMRPELIENKNLNKDEQDLLLEIKEESMS